MYGNGRRAHVHTHALHMIDLRDKSGLAPVQAQNWKDECCTTPARLRSTINITSRLHFPEHEDDCMEAYPLRAWLQVLGFMVMACGLLRIGIDIRAD